MARIWVELGPAEVGRVLRLERREAAALAPGVHVGKSVLDRGTILFRPLQFVPGLLFGLRFVPPYDLDLGGDEFAVLFKRPILDLGVTRRAG